MPPVALITGASRGIGRAVAEYFAAEGHTLILLARTEDRLQDLADSLRAAHGIKVTILALDIRNHAAVRAAVSAAVDKAGGLDVLVNAAGIFRYGTSVVSLDDLADMLETNVKAVHNLCSATLNALKAAPAGHVFNISSIVGQEGFAPVGGYAASKFALLGYSESLGKELLEHGVKVTTLCPDVVDTDMAAPSGLPPEQMIAREDITRAIDFVRHLSPAAIVDRIIIKCRTMEEFMNVRK
jgi:short-subunit dehydrogenase